MAAASLASFLLPLDIGLHIARRHQPHPVTERLKLARPMMRSRHSFDTNQARWQPLQKTPVVASLQLTANDHTAFRINAVNLKDRLRNIETDRPDRPWIGSSKSWGLNSNHSLALTCRWRSRPHGVIAGASCPSQSLVLEGGCSPIAWKYGLTTGRRAQASNGEQPWKNISVSTCR